MSDLHEITKLISDIDRKVSELQANVTVAQREAERKRAAVVELGLDPDNAKEEYKRLEAEREEQLSLIEKLKADAEEWLKNND